MLANRNFQSLIRNLNSRKYNRESLTKCYRTIKLVLFKENHGKTDWHQKYMLKPH